MTDTQSFTMPSSTADRAKIKETLQEMSGMLQRIEDFRGSMTDAAKGLEETFQIPKKIALRMARVLHKNNYSEVEAEADAFTTAFETLFKGGNISSSSFDDSDED